MRKARLPLTTDYYKHPKTMPFVFHFETPSSQKRPYTLKAASLEGKKLYIIDDFFSAEEAQAMRLYSQSVRFNKPIFASAESQKMGEIPARAMDGQEKWAFFTEPPSPIRGFYQFLSNLALHLEAEITTFPWDLCHETLSASAVATNYLERASLHNQEMGKHQDYNSETGLSFGIPNLYDSGFHPNSFINGEPGRPWLLSAIIYATAPHFDPTFGLGTLFYTKNGEIAERLPCCPFRLVLFEGDILHSIEASTLPPNLKTWRVSYVFKLIINPKKISMALEHALSDLSHRL